MNQSTARELWAVERSKISCLTRLSLSGASRHLRLSWSFFFILTSQRFPWGLHVDVSCHYHYCTATTTTIKPNQVWKNRHTCMQYNGENDGPLLLHNKAIIIIHSTNINITIVNNNGSMVVWSSNLLKYNNNMKSMYNMYCIAISQILWNNKCYRWLCLIASTKKELLNFPLVFSFKWFCGVFISCSLILLHNSHNSPDNFIYWL